MIEIKIQVKDEQGHAIEITKTYDEESLISHNFNKIEDLVEKVRTEMLGNLEREILLENQQAYIKKDCEA